MSISGKRLIQSSNSKQPKKIWYETLPLSETMSNNFEVYQGKVQDNSAVAIVKGLLAPLAGKFYFQVTLYLLNGGTSF